VRENSKRKMARFLTVRLLFSTVDLADEAEMYLKNEKSVKIVQIFVSARVAFLPSRKKSKPLKAYQSRQDHFRIA
jgi:hypothetical protein